MVAAHHQDLVIRLLEDNIALAQEIVRDYRQVSEEPAGDFPTPVKGAGKDKAYTFRMTEETLDRLRAAALREDRSIQWIFDRMMMHALDKHEKKVSSSD